MNISRNAMDRLAKIYEQIDHCQQCALGADNGYRLRCKPSSNEACRPVLIVSQNPSRHVAKGRNYVWGGLNLCFQYYPEAVYWADQAWITNLVKCTTPNNRGPKAEEVSKCEHWLEKEIECISPKKILALGNPAQRWLKQNHGEIPISLHRHPSFVAKWHREEMDDYLKELKAAMETN